MKESVKKINKIRLVSRIYKGQLPFNKVLNSPIKKWGKAPLVAQLVRTCLPAGDTGLTPVHTDPRAAEQHSPCPTNSRSLFPGARAQQECTPAARAHSAVVTTPEEPA